MSSIRLGLVYMSAYPGIPAVDTVSELPGLAVGFSFGFGVAGAAEAERLEPLPVAAEDGCRDLLTDGAPLGDGLPLEPEVLAR